MKESYVRTLSFVEGISYLALLFIAMPLKYVADLPMAVRVVGLAHGVLFVALALGIAAQWAQNRWPLKLCVQVLIVALLPFGALWLEARWRRQGTLGAP